MRLPLLRIREVVLFVVYVWPLLKGVNLSIVNCEAVPATAFSYQGGQGPPSELIGLAIEQALLVDQSSRNRCVAGRVNVEIRNLQQIKRVPFSICKLDEFVPTGEGSVIADINEVFIQKSIHSLGVVREFRLCELRQDSLDRIKIFPDRRRWCAWRKGRDYER